MRIIVTGRRVAWLAVALVVLCYCVACGPIPAPRPPQPVPGFAVAAWVHDQDGLAVADARCVLRDTTVETEADGHALFPFTVPSGVAQLVGCGKAGYGYVEVPFTATADTNVQVVVKADHVAPRWTRAQVADLQGDLMLWVPDSWLACPEDPATRIRCQGDNGAQPRGLMDHWVWALTAPWYPATGRQQLYQAAKDAGSTHFPVQVTRCTADGGYHGLYPRSQADCDGWTDRVNAVLQELTDRRLVPICTGATPDDPVLPGLNKALCPVAHDDWDNTDQKDCRIDYLGREFPDALIYVEMPAGALRPAADACTPGGAIPDIGGTWIFGAQKRVPNFMGVLYEVNYPDGLEANVRQFAALHDYFHAGQEVDYEEATYWELWDDLSRADAFARADAIRARAPWLHGFMTGGTTHPAPSGGDGGSTIDPTHGDDLDFGAARIYHSPDVRGWPVTAHVTKVDLSQGTIQVDFDRRAGASAWPNVQGFNPEMGVLQYTLGMCLVDAQDQRWDCSAVVQFWQGRDLSAGGGVDKVGQDWFYNAQWWGPLFGRQPQHGEQVGLFVVGGDCREDHGGSPTPERSNVVVVRWP